MRPKNWPEIRWKVLERDNWTCQKCGLKIDGPIAHVHHINGTEDNKLESLMSFCWICHPAEMGEDFWIWLKEAPNPWNEIILKLRENK